MDANKLAVTGLGPILRGDDADDAGSFSARLVSRRTMRAWACGLRRNPALAQRGSFMSSTYFPRPVRNRKSSGRGSGFPTYIL
jgi:hypothetical protein